jgi:hypothetical protein
LAEQRSLTTTSVKRDRKAKHQLKIEASQNKEAKVSDKQVTINGTKNPKKKK